MINRRRGNTYVNSGAAFAQVNCRTKGDWFLGIQGLVSDAQYRADTQQDRDYLDRVGAEDTEIPHNDVAFEGEKDVRFT